ncbi:MAG: IS3 family transposase [Terriglobia bacterium]
MRITYAARTHEDAGIELILRMVAENPTWGAPSIHGELLMLGFDVSERTISRWMKRAPCPGCSQAVADLSSQRTIGTCLRSQTALRFATWENEGMRRRLSSHPESAQ